jgi:hypothetical protein
MGAKYPTLRVGSTHYASGGTIHKVIRGSSHGLYNPNNGDYDVAVLKVCTKLDIPIDSAKYVMCL